MKYFVLFLFLCAGLNYSCKKDTEESTVEPQIDYIVLSGKTAVTDYRINVRYNKAGQIVQFGDETYSYNASGKVSRITVKPSYAEDTEGGVKSYFFDLSYDGQGRLKTLSDIKIETPENGLILRPDFRSHTLSYEGVSKIPLQAVYTTVGHSSSVVDFKHDGRNVTEEVKTITSLAGGSWTVPGTDNVMKLTVQYRYDNRPNVYRLLFGSLGVIPESVLRPDIFGSSFFYSENNVTSVVMGNITRSVNYSYDDKGRVKEVYTDFGSMKIFYK